MEFTTILTLTSYPTHQFQTRHHSHCLINGCFMTFVHTFTFWATFCHWRSFPHCPRKWSSDQSVPHTTPTVNYSLFEAFISRQCLGPVGGGFIFPVPTTVASVTVVPTVIAASPALATAVAVVPATILVWAVVPSIVLSGELGKIPFNCFSLLLFKWRLLLFGKLTDHPSSLINIHNGLIF